MATWRAVVLAAGSGTRMRSRTPKVLHPVCGRPLIWHVVAAVREAGLGPPAIVVSPDSSGIEAAVGDDADYVVQERPGGTGHALAQARQSVEGRADHLLVLCGDTPLITSRTLVGLMERHLESGARATILTAARAPQEGLGRVLRDRRGRVAAIVEEREASPAQLATVEANSGVYCLRAADLWEAIGSLEPSPSGERYLTGVVEAFARAGELVETVEAEDPMEVLGVNTRVHLAEAEAVLRERVRRRWMLEGVTLLDPPSTFIDLDVELGQDTVIYPNTHLYGKTRVGAGCRLGPNTLVQESRVGDGCTIVASVLEGSVVESGVEIGPFSHLRPGSHLGRGVHLGNFVEVKKSRLGEGVKAGHFSYIGDADVGERVNIGAGTVTCNFDGVNKNPTTIEEDAFIGCDTMLVAPVRVGRGAVTGAGAVVTRDVEPGSLVVGVPARPVKGKRHRRAGGL